MQQKEKEQRISLIDSIRGLAVASMVFYHFMYDWVYVFDQKSSWFSVDNGYTWQQSTLMCFIIISGVSSHFGKRPLKKGITVFLMGMLMTVVTVLVLPSEVIYFGVLHFIGCTMIIFAVCRPILIKIPAGWGAGISLLLFLCLRNLPQGIIGIDALSVRIPEVCYSVSGLFWLGFPSAGFYSADYVPMLPWIFLYMAAHYMWKLTAPHAARKLARVRTEPVFSLLGRHSLLIYLLHQPVLYGALLLFQELIK